MTIKTATSGSMLHGLICTRTLAKSIYVIQGSGEKPSPGRIFQLEITQNETGSIVPGIR